MTNVTGASHRIAVYLASGVLLLGPTVLAFYAGGFFWKQRVIAAGVAWALVAVATLTCRVVVPRVISARVAIATLVALTLWAALSMFVFAPLSTPAFDVVVLLLLFSGWLIAATAFLRAAAVQISVEPVLALGTLVVVGYALLTRLLPSVIPSSNSALAFGRLEQPLTYWNALGTIAGVGLLLCVRIAGDSRRPKLMRASACAGSVPMALAIYLTYSRGAIAAVVFGLAILLCVRWTRSQIQSAVLCCVAGVIACVVASGFDGISLVEQSRAVRNGQGAAVLGISLAIMALAAVAQQMLSNRSAQRSEIKSLEGWMKVTIALVAIAVVIGGGALISSEKSAVGANPSRLVSSESARYSYWDVALNGWTQRPVQGIGVGGFEALWLAQRTEATPARNPHSLFIQTLSELGLIGIALLIAFVAAIVAAGRRARSGEPALVAGWIAVLGVVIFHSGLDWVWQMPAVSLIALTLAGALIAEADNSQEAPLVNEMAVAAVSGLEQRSLD
ncbi:MAG: O-antigen ligase family protein [Solirubrobacterales bacterium]|nr:O-antigen ligase family protein [Solirubrobacterales bacterium]